MNEPHNPLAPRDDELSAHFGYIYEIRGPGGRLYVGKRHHKPGEAWSDYTGSGLRLRWEMARIEPDAFENPRAAMPDLLRKPGTVLRHYRKRWLAFADDAESLASLEDEAIEKLIASGRPTYNLDGADAADRGRIVMELSFERSLSTLVYARHSLQRFMPLLNLPDFDGVLAMLDEAERIRDNRGAFINGDRSGLRF